MRRLVHQLELLDELAALDDVPGARRAPIPPLLPSQQRARTARRGQGRLPGARDAGDAGEGPEGNARVDALEVVGARAPDEELKAVAPASLAPAPRCAGSPRRYLPVRLRARPGAAPRRIPGRRRARPAPPPRARGRSTWSAAREDGRVVLHHHHGVPLVAQRLQDPDQPLGVPRVQAHRRLVEHVERADEPRAQRRGEGDPLRLAPGERAEGRGRGSGSRGPPPSRKRRRRSARPRTCSAITALGGAQREARRGSPRLADRQRGRPRRCSAHRAAPARPRGAGGPRGTTGTPGSRGSG